MAHFLLVYDRDAGQLIRQQQFAHSDGALQARFLAEREFDDRPEVEIVALTAESEQALRRTHGRYFLGLSELARRLGVPTATR